MPIAKTLAIALALAIVLTAVAFGGMAMLPGMMAAYKANVVTTVGMASANAAVSMMLVTVLMLQR
ncbi:MAG: hypothetical protein AB7E80_03320 [Hyphomicrobiaceae bacterium]